MTYTKTLNVNYLNDTSLDFWNLKLVGMFADDQKQKWLDEQLYYTAIYQHKHNALKTIDAGGFEHGDLSGQYVNFQTNERYQSTRYFGWSSIFKLIHTKSVSLESSDSLIVDFLAGGGTLAQRVKQLWITPTPTVIGIDISKKMSELAVQKGEIVFWGSHDTHFIKPCVADVVVAAYGFHHVPDGERGDFVVSMGKVLKPGGVCLLHDFSSIHATSRFYSECIHKYRIGGHPYNHFTESSFSKLMKPHFMEVEQCLLYDPFYLEGLEGQDERSLKRECYAYLISLFNLSKLLPKTITYSQLFEYEDEDYWRAIEEIISPFLTLEDEELVKLQKSIINLRTSPFIKDIKVPLVKQPTIVRLKDKKLAIICPRSALVSVGIKR